MTGRPTTMTDEWKALAEACGGVSSLAEACGVHRDTVRRWASGEMKPAPIVQAAVDKLCAQHGVEPVFGTEAKMNRGVQRMVLGGKRE